MIVEGMSFTRLLYGLRYSMIYAMLVWAVSFSSGTMAGGSYGVFWRKDRLLGPAFG